MHSEQVELDMTKRGKISDRLRFEVLKRDGFKCSYCGVPATTTELVIDHINPVAAGGSDDYDNLTASCVNCNAGKRDVLLTERRPPKPEQTYDSRRAEGIAKGYCLCRKPGWRWNDEGGHNRTSYTRASFGLLVCSKCGETAVSITGRDGKGRVVYATGDAIDAARQDGYEWFGGAFIKVWEYIKASHNGPMSPAMCGIDVAITGTQMLHMNGAQATAERWGVSEGDVKSFWRKFYWEDFEQSGPLR